VQQLKQMFKTKSSKMVYQLLGACADEEEMDRRWLQFEHKKAKLDAKKAELSAKRGVGSCGDDQRNKKKARTDGTAPVDVVMHC
jgi:hypothetical protein